jgi:hypothetical protein
MVAGKYIELKNGGRSSALIVSYGKKESAAIIESLKSGQGSAAKGGIAPALVDLLSRAIPAVTAGLSSGHIFQVIGTPALVEGMQAGTHALIQTSAGALGTVINTSTGQIAGQLRFAPSTMAPVVAPALTWSLLNGLLGTLQIQRVNERLDVITRKLEMIQVRQEAAEVGRVSSAVSIVNQILSEFDHIGRFSQFSLTRLANAENDIGAALERNKVLLNTFNEKLRSIKNRRGAEGAESAAALLEEEGEVFVQDLRLFNSLISAQALVFKVQLLHDISQDPEVVDYRLSSVQEFMEANIDCVASYPDLAELENHAELCAAEMSWFQRNISQRSTAKKVKTISTQSKRIKARTTDESPVPNVVFWKDGDRVQCKFIDQEIPGPQAKAATKL